MSDNFKNPVIPVSNSEDFESKYKKIREALEEIVKDSVETPYIQSIAQKVLDEEKELPLQELFDTTKKQYDELLGQFKETHNILIGPLSGEMLTSSGSCTFIGVSAGSLITNPKSGLVIIGDNILDDSKDQSGVIYIGERMLVGERLFGQPNQLYNILKNVNEEREGDVQVD